MPKRPTHYALVIGINDYPGYGSRRTLQGAVRDATRFKDWLCDTTIGGGLDPANCELIVSSDNPVRPIHEEIDNALERIVTAAAAAGGPAERLYFYFSGHGLSMDTHNVALCLANWSGMRRHAALSSHQYLEYLKQCSPFREVIVFLDCCRIRQGGVIGRASELGCAVPVDGAGAKRHLIGYATEFGDTAFEAPDTTDDEVRGHFTEVLLAALSGAAARPAGGVTAAALQEYLEKNVQLVAKASNHKQIAQVPSDLPGHTLFGSAKPIANCTIRFSAARQGQILLEDPDLTPVHQADVTTAPWTLGLRPGLYCLTEIGTGTQYNFRFQPVPGFNDVTF
ncbi:caspase family protein [Mesorhizobium onobrychidis]|uniref:Caspase family protein n=1 Tax=Mesorhizobium onobrychidis TaxID=2775404 RepID=A0ABY5R813_9HYPH|nr:caspase family protein [Mesorhizobium onobrychidis]UVC19339.1 caspase family protein [Mesorhizobium onobrychidis]